MREKERLMMRFILFLVALCSITNFSQASIVATLEAGAGQEYSNYVSTNPVGDWLESIEVSVTWETAFGISPEYLTLYITSPDGDYFDIGFYGSWDWDSGWGTGAGEYFANIDVSQLDITGTGIWELHAHNAAWTIAGFSMDVILHDLNMPAPATLALLAVAGFTTRRRS
jgi:hypothetical protein|tara:strand:- start:1540 stop:2049 length:510 start_codon:yes stop_codon:yes gene_type:complete